MGPGGLQLPVTWNTATGTPPGRRPWPIPLRSPANGLGPERRLDTPRAFLLLRRPSRGHAWAVLPSGAASRRSTETVVVAQKFIRPCLRSRQETWLENTVSWGGSGGQEGLLSGFPRGTRLPSGLHLLSHSRGDTARGQSCVTAPSLPTKESDWGEMCSVCFLLQGSVFLLIAVKPLF